MDALTLLREAEADGVTIDMADGDLVVEASRAKKHWLAKLRPHKAEILAHLTGEPIEDEPPITPEAYTPFPVHTLPGPVGEFVAAASKAIGCDPSFVALPLLACLARSIGNKRVIRLKRTWTEPAIIWAAIVGKSGTHKSPALQAAMKFLERRQAEKFAEHPAAMQQYDQDRQIYERDLAAWKRAKKTDDDPPPWPPVEPVCERYITSDTTIEAMAAMLAAQFDGVLVSRDELAGWLGGIAEYKGGKGSDLGHWLSLWNAHPLTVDRKTGAVKMIHVPRAAASLIGGIQPDVLRRAIGREHMQDGLCARLLLAMPDAKPRRWSEATVHPDVEAALGSVFDRLLSMEPAADENGQNIPFPLDLTPEAKAVWTAYYDRHGAEILDLDGDLAAAWSKLEAYTARFALILQLCEWAAGDAAAGNAIDETSMRAAIELSEWFGREAKRVYGLFVEDADGREQRELVELIRRRGGRITPRELCQGSRRFAKVSDAEAALNGLAASGYGRWEIVQTGGRPRREFVLSTPSTYTKAHETAEISTSVYVDTVDSPVASPNGHTPDVADHLFAEGGEGRP